MSLEDLLRKLASSAEASPEIFTIPREIQVFAHDDTSARAVLARLRSEWEAYASSSPRKALVLALGVFRVSRDWQRRWPLGAFLPNLAETLRVVSADPEVEREVAALLRELPKHELTAVLAHAASAVGPGGTCLDRLGGARVLGLVGSFAHPTHEEHHSASGVDAVLAAVASVGPSSLDDLHAALGVFAGTLDEVARATFLLGAVQVSVDAGLPLAEHWLIGARGHETLSDALARPFDEGPLAAAFASVVTRLPAAPRLAVLEKSAVAFMPTYGHFVGRDEPSFVQATVEACAALGGDGKHTLGRAKTAARVITMLGPSAEAAVVRALPSATPEGLLAFTLASKNEEVARFAVELLGHAHKDVRREAAEALRSYGPAADRALDEGTRAKKKAVRETCSALLAERRSALENPIDRALAALDESARAELETAVSRLSSEASILQSFGNPRQLANAAFDAFGPAAYLASAYRRWLSHPESRDAERPVTFGLERWMETREPASSNDQRVTELFVHVAVHLPALEDHQVERFVQPLVPFLRAHTGRLAAAIAHRGEVAGRIVLVEAVLAKNPADVPTAFWAEAMADSSKRIRKIAAQSLVGRSGVSDALAPVLAAKKAEIRVAVAELVAREKFPAMAEALRAARAVETDAKASAALDRALAAVPEGANGPGPDRAAPVARQASSTEGASPNEVRAELAAMKKGKIPKFASSALLPSPSWTDGVELSEHEIGVLFSRLASEGTDLEEPHVRRIRAALTPASAQAFGDALYDAWYEGGRDSKHKFAVFQLGIFGSDRRLDEVAQRLGIEASHGQHHYSSWCLEALGRRGRALASVSNGTEVSIDTGLSWVAHWARAATTESLGHRARELLARERELRGLDERAFAARVNPFVAADAADRAIVRVDLGTRFTFGARSFSPTVVHGRLALRADNGTVLEALPKRSPKDEPATHENEKQRFEALSGHVAHVLAWESSRLEGAMVSHRVWPVPAFLELAAHPLVRHLLEGLLARAGTQLFRASLAGPVDVDSRPMARDALLAAPGVTLPHRIDLDALTLAAWREHLRREDVRAPFAQLDREVHVDSADLVVDRLRTLRAQALVARLLEARWQHGRPHENGLYDESFRLFSGYGVRAVFHHDGIGIASNDFQTGPIGLHSLRFEDVFGKTLDPAEVPAVVRSEVARDLRTILR